MSIEKKSSAGSTILGIVIGIVLMVAGAWGAQNGEFGLGPTLHNLEESGIPLSLGKTVSTIGVFLILFPVIRSFFLTPLTQAIGERNGELERTFSEAESLRTEMTQLRNDYEKRLATTEAQAREQIQNQIREAQNLRQTLMTEATERADAMVARAQQEITAERDRIVTELRTQVVDLTLAATEKVIGENLDDARNRRLVEDFINRVEVAR